jgi:hypothetical protein
VNDNNMMMGDFWVKVNQVMTPDDRVAYNEWRRLLWLACDRIRDVSRSPSQSDFLKEQADTAMQLVDELPAIDDIFGQRT